MAESSTAEPLVVCRPQLGPELEINTHLDHDRRPVSARHLGRLGVNTELVV